MAEYAGMNILEAMDLPVDMFALCYKNWAVDRLMQSEEGREYIKDCERLRQTKMDFEGLARLRAQLGG